MQCMEACTEYVASNVGDNVTFNVLILGPVFPAFDVGDMLLSKLSYTVGDIDIGPRHYDRATTKYVKKEKN